MKCPFAFSLARKMDLWIGRHKYVICEQYELKVNIE